MMKSKIWLVIDSNYLCHRAFHTTGDLIYNGKLVGMLYGFFTAILGLQEEYQTKNILFCFDAGCWKRKEIYPQYKAHRKKRIVTMNEEEQSKYKVMRHQIVKLRDSYLPKIGFRNIFSQPGYEADDIIASLVHNTLSRQDRIVIVSADKDLFQLLDTHIEIHNPATKRTITQGSFQEQWGIDPAMWASVKALAGCSTDGVEGINGIGEKTAAKWFQGKLRESTKAYKRITENLDIHNRNIQLVRLPFEDVEKFEIKFDCVTSQAWGKVEKKLGMELPIVDYPPPKGIKKK